MMLGLFSLVLFLWFCDKMHSIMNPDYPPPSLSNAKNKQQYPEGNAGSDSFIDAAMFLSQHE